MKENYLMQEAEAVKVRMQKYLITSGYNFEGRIIESYHGPVAGDALGGVFVTALLTPVGKYPAFCEDKQMDGMEIVRCAAIDRLLNKVDSFGANGVIGLSWQYTVLGKEALLVTATGTAVTVK